MSEQSESMAEDSVVLPVPAMRFLIKLPTPGSDPTIIEEKGPEAGQRYVRAKYGDDDEAPEEQSAGGGKKKNAIAGMKDLVSGQHASSSDVPPNFNLLVVFALGLLRALLRKMSGGAD